MRTVDRTLPARRHHAVLASADPLRIVRPAMQSMAGADPSESPSDASASDESRAASSDAHAEADRAPVAAAATPSPATAPLRSPAQAAAPAASAPHAAPAPNDRTVSTSDDPTPPPASARPSGLPSPDDPTRTSTGELPNEPPVALRPREDRLPAPLQIRDPDRYQIINEHGRGGLGRVFRARDKELGRDVAVKELLHRGNTAELRFFREALITARLEHPGIVPVHEAGRWPDGTPFYAMKLVQGRPLKALIDECKTLEDRLALLPHIIAVADAIAYAHDRKIIHRDLKPSNVIVGDFGETVVIDWGLAKDLTDEVPELSASEAAAEGAPYRAAVAAIDGLTVAGSVLGTPAYMAPEQARGEAVDERADVYAIGAILHLLCDRPSGKRSIDLVQADLRAVTARCLAVSPTDRYQNARVLVADLRAVASGSRVSARAYTPVDLARRWFRQHRVVAIMIAAFVTTAALGSAVALERLVEERDRAITAERAVREERERLLATQARASLSVDPTATLAWLKAMSPESRLRNSLREELVPRAVGAGIATQILQTRHSVDYVAYSPSGNHLLTCSDGGELIIWRRDGTRVASTTGACIRRPVFSADGLDVFTAGATGGATSWRWQEDTFRAIHSTTSPIYDISLDGDAITLVTGPREYLRVSLQSDAALGARPTTTTLPEAVRIITATSNGVLLHNGEMCCELSTRTDIARAEGAAHIGTPRDHVTISNNEILVRAESGIIASITLDPFHVRTIDAPLVPPLARDATTFGGSVDGRWLAFGDRHGSTHLVDMHTHITHHLQGHQQGITDIQFRDDTLATASADGTVRIWRLPPHEATVLRTSQESVFTLAFDKNHHRLFADGQSGSLRSWDLADGGTPPERRLLDHGATAFGLQLSPSGRFVVSPGWSGRVFVWDVDAGACIRTLRHTGIARGVAISPDERTLVSVGSDGTMWIADLQTDSPARSLQLGRGLWRATFTGNTTVVVSTEDGALLELDTATDSVFTLARHTAPIRFLLTTSKTPPFHIVAGGDDSLISVIGSRHSTWTVPVIERVHAMATSPDGTLLAVKDGSENIAIWDLANRREVTRIPFRTSSAALCFVDPTTMIAIEQSGLAVRWSRGVGVTDAWRAFEGSAFTAVCDPQPAGPMRFFVGGTEGSVFAWSLSRRRSEALSRSLESLTTVTLEQLTATITDERTIQ